MNKAVGRNFASGSGRSTRAADEAALTVGVCWGRVTKARPDKHGDGDGYRGHVEPTGSAHPATWVRIHAATLSAITDCPSSVGPMDPGCIRSTVSQGGSRAFRNGTPSASDALWISSDTATSDGGAGVSNPIGPTTNARAPSSFMALIAATNPLRHGIGPSKPLVGRSTHDEDDLWMHSPRTLDLVGEGIPTLAVRRESGAWQCEVGDRPTRSLCQQGRPHDPVVVSRRVGVADDRDRHGRGRFRLVVCPGQHEDQHSGERADDCDGENHVANDSERAPPDGQRLP